MSERITTSQQVTRAQPPHAQPSAPQGPSAVPRVAGYEIGRQVGKGGMGVVWEAFEHRLERKVALKVHSGGATPERVAQLWSEAKLAARIAHPGVVSVHDVGTTQGGQPYYTMDLIEGASLRATLRAGPLPSPRALTIGIEIADAVAAAHECGIVHCDLKPSNILLDAQGRVRILDFGIAERLDDKRERSGEVFGSPPYIAPERIHGEAPTVTSDVYSIGVILYEMIAGQRPFKAPSKDALLRAVLEEEPPKLPPESLPLHPDLERVCHRCLKKSPEERLASARALHDALVAIREGRSLPDETKGALALASRAPTLASWRAKLSRESATSRCSFRFVFDAPPEQVWRYLADTDQLARAMGCRPVSAATQRAPEGHRVRTGMVQVLGLTFRWEDEPYAWVRHSGLSTSKSFPEGPFVATWSQLSLRSLDEGDRTELILELSMLRRGALGFVLERLPLKLFWALRFGRYFQRIAARLAASRAPEPAFDEPPHRPSGKGRARVEKAAAHLTRVLRFPEALVAELTKLLLYAPDKKLERLRPFALADAWGARRDEVLDLFLHAVSSGLVEIAWDLICAECRLPYERVPSLQKVAQVGTCASCGAAYEGDLATSVELIFRPHRGLRAIRPAMYCSQTPAYRPHIVAQQIFDPGERREVVVDLDRGAYRLIAARGGKAWDFAVSAVGSSPTCSLRLTREAIDAHPLVVRAGAVTIDIENATSREEVFRLEAVGEAGDRVTAAIALSHPSFHAFCSEERIADGEHLAVSRMAFLFIDIAFRRALLAQHGDAGALQILSQIGQEVLEQVEAQQGTLVQADASVGILVAAFAEGALAVKAALGVSARGGAIQRDAKVRAAVHQGRCVALSRDGQIQYFGETIERGVALLNKARPGSVLASIEIGEDRDAARVLLEGDVDRVISVASARAGRSAAGRE